MRLTAIKSQVITATKMILFALLLIVPVHCQFDDNRSQSKPFIYTPSSSTLTSSPSITSSADRQTTKTQTSSNESSSPSSSPSSVSQSSPSQQPSSDHTMVEQTQLKQQQQSLTQSLQPITVPISPYNSRLHHHVRADEQESDEQHQSNNIIQVTSQPQLTIETKDSIDHRYHQSNDIGNNNNYHRYPHQVSHSYLDNYRSIHLSGQQSQPLQTTIARFRQIGNEYVKLDDYKLSSQLQQQQSRLNSYVNDDDDGVDVGFKKPALNLISNHVEDDVKTAEETANHQPIEKAKPHQSYGFGYNVDGKN